MKCPKETEFEKYYLKYYRQVYGYILKKVFNEHIAEDLTMDVFCSIWEKFETFDENKASFQTWLYVIINNRLKNFYRDRKEFVELNDSMADENNNSDDIVEAIHMQFLRDHLYIVLERLNEVQRKIVIYKYFENLNSSEISRLVGLTPGNIRINLKRSLEIIREYFEVNEIRWK